MTQQIPLTFESLIIDSPALRISDNISKVYRLKVRVFTKFGNRNGSYITESVASQLIDSAIQGTTPVIGFFDPETRTWASHTGPMLANAYGYVEDFLGWEPFEDTDGKTRDYAVFSIVLFSDYFEEANEILGQNQSMELDPASITGDWGTIEDTPYFIYKTAKMLGFCIIGEHEPCFSVSAFYDKNENNFQFENFSSLLSDLKTQVELLRKKNEGGEQLMDNFENKEVDVENTPEVHEEEVSFQISTEEVTESTNNEIESNENENEEEDTSEEIITANEPTEYEMLQERFNELQNSFEQVQQTSEQYLNMYNEQIAKVNDLQQTIDNLNAQIASFQKENEAREEERKQALVMRYEKILSQEEINAILGQTNDLTYDALESKLAIIFAQKNLYSKNEEIVKVPVPEPQKSQFALLMEKYRKN